MSHGPGQLQRAILDFMQQIARHQRKPQRAHWRVEQLVLNIIRRDPKTGEARSFTGRQHADARKRIRRACDRLAAIGQLQKVGVGWTLPPETPAEARARRKRTKTSAQSEQEQMRRASTGFRSIFDAVWTSPPIDRATRSTLVKVLGLLSSNHDGEVLTAARQAERLRKELGVTWNELIAAS